MPTQQQCQIQAVSATYTTAHNNDRSFSHWVRPGIEPTSSWILVRFLSAEPWQELLVCFSWSHLFFCFVGPHLKHMEVSSLEAESELQLLAYTTATVMQDLSCICDLHHSSQQHQILNPLSKAKDRTCILMVTSQICFCWAKTKTPEKTKSWWYFLSLLVPDQSYHWSLLLHEYVHFLFAYTKSI